MANDVAKIADMDQKPAFLATADLERLAKHPEVGHSRHCRRRDNCTAWKVSAGQCFAYRTR